MNIICPECKAKNVPGTLFCVECGGKMFTETSGIPTQTIRDRSVPQESQKGTLPFEEPVSAIDAVVSLHIVRTGQILPLSGRDDFTLGRVSEGQSIIPDIDLSQFDAYTQGVSRLHATVKIRQNAITITDLGSSNGTRINNVKIAPHTPHQVKHGDILAIGKLKIQTLIREED